MLVEDESNDSIAYERKYDNPYRRQGHSTLYINTLSFSS